MGKSYDDRSKRPSFVAFDDSKKSYTIYVEEERLSEEFGRKLKALTYGTETEQVHRKRKGEYSTLGGVALHTTDPNEPDDDPTDDNPTN